MKKIYLVLITLMFSFGAISTTQACTLWAAAGSKVESGGVLIAKNRDWQPDHNQELRLIQPKQGYRYLGLFAVDGEAPGLKAGINEPGLVVISATASSIPRRNRLSEPATKNILAKLLTQSATVDQALSHRDYFIGCKFLMLADRTKTALIEIAPQGKIVIEVSTNGVLCHTNHYLEPKLLWANQKIGTSSKTRLQRIESLLGATAKPFDLNDFIRFSNDQTAGPDNSIWRIGRSTRSTRTLAAWIVWLPPTGDPQLYLKIANPHQVPTIQLLNTAKIIKRSTNHRPDDSTESPLQ